MVFSRGLAFGSWPAANKAGWTRTSVRPPVIGCVNPCDTGSGDVEFMKVLVAFASRHGATTDIAAAIGTALRNAGLDTDIRPVEDLESLAGYDAAILGSALYMGQWLKPARSFTARHHQRLAAMPLWLFSSGPIGDPPFPREDSPAVEKLAADLNARGHQTFPGKLDRDQLGLVEEAMIAALHALPGDFRDWPAIDAWARGIARELLAVPEPSGGHP